MFVFCGEKECLFTLNALSVIGDHHLAAQEAEIALADFPNSSIIFNAAVKTFAKAGLEDKMMEAFRKFQKIAKDPYPRDLLEDMAWGVIEKGSYGTAPLVRAIALIAAAVCNDARGVSILQANCSDSHKLIRGLAIEFGSKFRDEVFQDIVKERLKVEKDPAIRVVLLQTIGRLQMKEMEGELLSILENERSSMQEKAAAVASLLAIKDKIDPIEIQRLVNSNRAALRAFAAELVDCPADAFLLIPLLKDSHSEVRKAALIAFGRLRISEAKDHICPLLFDSIPDVAITAAYVWTLFEPAQGQQYMEKWLDSGHDDERLYASIALKMTGKYGFPLNKKVLLETKDPYVKLNLGVGLIQEKMDPYLGSSVLYDVVMNHKEKISERNFGQFSGIGPCIATHRADIPHYPEALNQMTRLELLNLLAIERHPKAELALLQFLKERPWGITGTASALLLAEGDEEALVLIRELLKDESEKVQLQAALILAFWGSDRKAIDTLQRLYFKVPHNKKEQIIEAFGRIGDFSSVPFLVDRLEEPQVILRMSAAAALLQTLYH